MEAPTASTFLYDQLVAFFSKLIEVGTLRPGDRLPSVRHLSRKRGVSVSTVLRAYRLLEDQRLIEARPQSGYFVRARLRPHPLEPRPASAAPSPCRVNISDLVIEVLESIPDPDIVPLSAAVPSLDLLPTRRLNRMMASVARTAGASGNRYSLPLGEEDLRAEIARRLADGGMALAPDDLLITCGCMEALALSLRAIARPGDAIAVESPAYFGVLQLIESLDMQALEIPMHPRHGLDIEALVAAIDKKPIAACLVTPNFHNPLGSLMPDAHKAALVAEMSVRGIPIIEDDIYGELHFGPTRPVSLQSFDHAGEVLHCGSFSKTLAPGYRIGWLAPGRFMAEVKRIKYATTIAAPPLPQMALASYLHHGGYDRHLRSLRRIFAGNLQRMTHAVAEFFPEGTRATQPQGGFVLWVEMPESVDALALYRTALRQKISIAPGPIFTATRGYRHCIRLNGGYPWSDQIEGALSKLGNLSMQGIPGVAD